MTTEAPGDAAQLRPAGSSQMFVSDSKPDTGEVVRGAQGLCCKSFDGAKNIASTKYCFFKGYIWDEELPSCGWIMTGH